MLVVKKLMYIFDYFLTTRVLVNKLSKFRLIQFVVPFWRSQNQSKNCFDSPQCIIFQPIDSKEITELIKENRRRIFCVIPKDWPEESQKYKNVTIHKFVDEIAVEKNINVAELECYITKAKEFAFVGQDFFQIQAKSILVQYATKKPFYYHELNNLIKRPVAPFTAVTNDWSDGSIFSNKTFALDSKDKVCGVTDANLVPTNAILNLQNSFDKDQHLYDMAFNLLSNALMAYLNGGKLINNKTQVVGAIKILLHMLQTNKFNQKDMGICAFLVGTSGANVDGLLIDQLAYSIAVQYHLPTEKVKPALALLVLKFAKQQNESKGLHKTFNQFLKELYGPETKITQDEFINSLTELFDKYHIDQRIVEPNQPFTIKQIRKFTKSFVQNYGLVFNDNFVSITPKMMRCIILHAFI